MTAMQIYEAHAEGEPLIITAAQARREVARHGQEWSDFVSGCGDCATYDAWVVLAWLGY